MQHMGKLRATSGEDDWFYRMKGLGGNIGLQIHPALNTEII